MKKIFKKFKKEHKIKFFIDIAVIPYNFINFKSYFFDDLLVLLSLFNEKKYHFFFLLHFIPFVLFFFSHFLKFLT